VKLNFTACDKCGAVTSISGGDTGSGIDNREAHDQWHAGLRGVIRQASSPIGVVYESQLEGI